MIEKIGGFIGELEVSQGSALARLTPFRVVSAARTPASLTWDRFGRLSEVDVLDSEDLQSLEQ